MSNIKLFFIGFSTSALLFLILGLLLFACGVKDEYRIFNMFFMGVLISITNGFLYIYRSKKNKDKSE